MTVERQALRRLYLGESIAPFRILEPAEAVVAWDGTKVMDSASAGANGFPRLAAWLDAAEQLWNSHKSANTKLSFRDQIDYFGKLSGQFPLAPIRILYSKAGTLPAAAILRASDAIIDHKLYWCAAATESEALFLTGILNSETARERVEHMQSRGQWGARDFDKVMFELPIPEFDESVPLHSELADAGGVAETVAAAVDITGQGFIRARGSIRQALRDDGISGRIDELVEQLLGP